MVAVRIVSVVVALGMTLVSLAVVGRTAGYLVSVMRLGQSDPTRYGRRGERLAQMLRETIGHQRLGRWPLVGIMHWFVFVGFGALFFTLVTAFGQLFSPTFHLPWLGHWVVFEWGTEIIAWLTGLGILTLIVIRQKNHPRGKGRRSRFFGSTFWQAYYVEATILAIVVCIVLLRGLEHDVDPRSAVHYPLTAWVGSIFSGASAHSVEIAIVVIAAVKIVVSFAWFLTIGLNPTMGVAWHRFTAFFNVWFKRHPGGRPNAAGQPIKGTSLGALAPMASHGKPIDFEDPAEDDTFGVGVVEDMTWKGLLDLTTCTECGRCQSQCPAWNTEKPLSPKLLVLALRDHAYAKAPYLLAGEDAKDGVSEAAAAEAQRTLVASLADGGVIDPEVLWSCTTCGACVEQCPVDIEHVDHIVDMRRHQVLIESAFPSELNGLFKNLENKGNPWGLPQSDRLGWAKDLGFDVPVVGRDLEGLDGTDYLFWVGCAGAYDDRAKKTTRAVAELLHTAGVSFAVLGEGETCTGDSARRAGNEFLFQMLAQQNVETLNDTFGDKADKAIVVTCAHCFNAIGNEYPQLGGEYKVIHHTQLLNRLVREGRLTPVTPVSEAVTYHDPCYLGRHNGVYSPPRELIGSLPGAELREMPRHAERSFCCGAGGARMWMEEKVGKRINAERTDEAVGTGATMIATGCPFCRVMLTDGLTTAQSGGTAPESVQVVDVAQLLLARVKPAAPPPSPPAPPQMTT